MQFSGEFETHITVYSNDLDEVKRLREWSANHGLKCLYILLDRGVSLSQPMLTRNGWGNFSNELVTANTLCQTLTAEGFSVVRIKIEAAPWNDGVPQSNLEALNYSSDQYFEHHIKLLLEPSTDVTQLMEIAERHSAHLSRNALQTRSDRYQERFITQRCMIMGCNEAEQQLQGLLTAIANLKYPIIEIEQEFVVYDSNLDLDKGWIEI